MFTLSTSAISKNSLSRRARGHILTQEAPRNLGELIFMGFIVPLVGVEPLRIALEWLLHRFCKIICGRWLIFHGEAMIYGKIVHLLGLETRNVTQIALALA